MKSSPHPVAVLGAGFAGLVAAVEFKRHGFPVIVFEAGPEVGGLARTFTDADGFSNDFGAHFITNRLAASLGVSADCRTVRRHGEAVYANGRVYSYPYGLILHPRYALSGLRSRLGHRGEPVRTAGDAFRALYGAALTREVIEPLVEAWSGLPLDDLAPVVVEKLPGGVLQTLWLKLASRISRRAIAIGYGRFHPRSASVYHVYPETGLGLLTGKLMEELGDVVEVKSPVESILVEDQRVRAVVVHGRERPVQAVVSTAPVHVLPRLVKGSDALSYLSRFRYRPMTFANLRLHGRRLLADVTNWFPDHGPSLFRVSEAVVSMPWLAPEGKTTLTVDFGCEAGDAIWTASDGEMAETALSTLEEFIPDVRQRFISSTVLRTPLAYPVFALEYEPDRQRLEQGTGIKGLLSVGRNGEFAHILLEDLYWRTLQIVRRYVHGR